MPNKRRVREPILIACEGDCEAAYVKFLHKLLPEESPFYLRSENLHGGGPEAMLYQAAHLAEKKHNSIKRENLILLIDEDGIETQFASSQLIDAFKNRVRKKHFRLILMRPNFEGLLLRHFLTQESNFPSKTQAMRELKRFWPQYEKSPSESMLSQRFSITDVLRAGSCDPQMRSLLSRIGLL